MPEQLNPNRRDAYFSYKQRTAFSRLLYHGDWHTNLQSSLELALASVQSRVTRKLLEALIKRLKECDECEHLVTQAIEAPSGMNSSYLLAFIEKEMPFVMTAKVDGQIISVTVTLRGSVEHVNGILIDELRLALNSAKYAITRNP